MLKTLLGNDVSVVAVFTVHKTIEGLHLEALSL